ncbi:MAG: hypothetical protein LBQ39_01050, partial [Tannerellaceae bacterium]|nr:hypothetical protein [Tannerellaceae bacterium]
MKKVNLLIILSVLISCPLLAQVEVVRDEKTQEATVINVKPLKPEIERFEPFVWKSETPADCPFPASKTFGQIKFTGLKSGFYFADTFYPSWGDDDLMYSPYTDG